MLRSSFFWAQTSRFLFAKRKSFVMQTARTDCGVACTLTVVNLLGRSGDPVHAVEELDADRTGSNLEAMRKYMETRHGFVARALAVPAHKLGEVKGRLILHMDQMHYVVLLRRSRKGVLVFDPAKGPVFYPTADFSKLYSGHLLEVNRPPRGTTVPQKTAGRPSLGARHRDPISSIGLFVVGVASRILECTILLCIVAALFLVLNRASTASILMVFLLVALCGAVLLWARHLRVMGEANWAQRRQDKIWHGLLRTFLKGKDINGFRGRPETDVSSTLRHDMTSVLPQFSQVPAAIGAVLGIAALLALLNPWLSLAHLGLFAGLLVIMQLDEIQVCRVSLRPGIGRYSKLGQGHSPLNATVASELFGECSKWLVIGTAGFSVLLADLSPVALMFWILTGMQIVPLDFKRAKTLAPILKSQQLVSPMTTTEVPLRNQTVGGPVDLKISRSNGIMRIKGIEPLTATLQQRDLTVREQRLILADIVRHTFLSLAPSKRPKTGPIRIFASGHEATQSDFEYLMISRESDVSETLPAIREGRKTVADAATNRFVRDLHSCDYGDFPVFWDFRGQIKLEQLQDHLRDSGLAKAGHLTLTRMSVIEVP